MVLADTLRRGAVEVLFSFNVVSLFFFFPAAGDYGKGRLFFFTGKTPGCQYLSTPGGKKRKTRCERYEVRNDVVETTGLAFLHLSA